MQVGSLGQGRFPGEGSGIPVQYSCLENPVERGDWWATVHGIAKELDTTEHMQPTLLPTVYISHSPILIFPLPLNICNQLLPFIHESAVVPQPQTPSSSHPSKPNYLEETLFLTFSCPVPTSVHCSLAFTLSLQRTHTQEVVTSLTANFNSHLISLCPARPFSIFLETLFCQCL